MNKYTSTQWESMGVPLEAHPDKPLIYYLSRQFCLDPKLMYWLYLQGYQCESKINSLFFTNLLDLHDPFLLNDMKKALYRIIKAIKTKEKILIFGDYDADGITSTTILYKALMHFNAQVSFQLPLREEGYGISPKAIEKISSQNVGLIVTVDNGSSANEAIESAKMHDIDVIVTDHHDILNGHPNCYAFINPKRTDSNYPFNDLCGAGVALKLVQGLFILAKQSWNNHAAPYIELATIGTIADLVSLHNENRTICRIGLQIMNTSPQPVLRKLFKILNISDVDSSTIAFRIGPIFNAVGRVDNPNKAVELLTNENTTETELKSFIEINKKRQVITNEQYQQAEQDIYKNLLHDQSVIVVNGNFNKGIIGIIASKISEKFHKPSIVISDCGTASCRGVTGSEFSMINTLERCSDLFLKYGGHKAAAGFSINYGQIEEFKQKVQYSAIQEGEIERKKLYLCPFPVHQISNELINEFELLEPFGMGFQKPLFFSGKVKPKSIETFGQNNQHLKMSFGGKKVTAFMMGTNLNQLRDKYVALLYSPLSYKHKSLLLDDLKVVSTSK